MSGPVAWRSLVPAAAMEPSAATFPLAGRPGDRHEREADRAAEEALRDVHADAAPGPDPAREGALDPGTRRFFEGRFGHSFANVRVHADGAAGESARRMGARAYTVGEHISFAPGEYSPSTREGKHLLAHELAHVVQQTRGASPAPAVQAKLVATGDAAGFVALVNSILAVQYEIVASSTGEITIRGTRVQGPPTLEASELLATIRAIVNDSDTTTIEFIRGRTSTNPAHRRVVGGAYATSQVDLDDISAFGHGEGMSAASTLAHELTEQYRKQAHGEGFAVAHRAGLAAELRMTGAVRGSETVRRIDASTVEVTAPYRYPDGSVVDVVMTVRNGNIVNVTRRRRGP